MHICTGQPREESVLIADTLILWKCLKHNWVTSHQVQAVDLSWEEGQSRTLPVTSQLPACMPLFPEKTTQHLKGARKV